MTRHETAAPYTRSTLNPTARRFQRWLVIVDVMPDVEAVAGFQQIALPRRTLNVVAQRELAPALELIKNMNASMRQIAAQNSWSSAFRYGFCLIDLASQTAVTLDQVQQWAQLHTVQTSNDGTEGQRDRDLVQAAAIARNMGGKAAPQPVLLDTQDPITVLKTRQLLPIYDSVPVHVNTSDDPFAGVVTPEEYNAAVKQAEQDKNNAWTIGLSTLPSMIEDSINRTLDSKTQMLTSRLMQRGLSETSPRLAFIRAILGRTLAPLRKAVMSEVYRQIITKYIDYTSSDKLDLVVLATLDSVAFAGRLPAFLQMNDPDLVRGDQHAVGVAA